MNYMITEEEGNNMVNAVDMHAHTGLDVQSVMFSNECWFTMAIDVVGLGINNHMIQSKAVRHAPLS